MNAPSNLNLKPGRKVFLVDAHLNSIPATVDKVTGGNDGLIDLTAVIAGKPVIITNSPFNAAANTPDSWHAEPIAPASPEDAPPAA